MKDKALVSTKERLQSIQYLGGHSVFGNPVMQIPENYKAQHPTPVYLEDFLPSAEHKAILCCLHLNKLLSTWIEVHMKEKALVCTEER